MEFKSYRDFEPRQEDGEYCLGLMIHDDGDVIKWDWTVYKQISGDMYEEMCSLEVSPYERNEHHINRMFRKQVNLLRLSLDNNVK